jgi:hypothetical protein
MQHQLNILIQKQNSYENQTQVTLCTLNLKSTPSISAPQSRKLVILPIFINDWNPAKVLIDPGATSCFITEQYCKNTGIEIFTTGTAYIVKGYDNKSTSQSQIAVFKVEMHTVQWQMAAIVLPSLPSDCQLLFGMNCCERFSPNINWKEKTLELDRTKIATDPLTTDTDIILANMQVLPVLPSSNSIVKMHNSSFDKKKLTNAHHDKIISGGTKTVQQPSTPTSLPQKSQPSIVNIKHVPLVQTNKNQNQQYSSSKKLINAHHDKIISGELALSSNYRHQLVYHRNPNHQL